MGLGTNACCCGALRSRPSPLWRQPAAATSSPSRRRRRLGHHLSQLDENVEQLGSSLWADCWRITEREGGREMVWFGDLRFLGAYLKLAAGKHKSWLVEEATKHWDWLVNLMFTWKWFASWEFLCEQLTYLHLHTPHFGLFVIFFRLLRKTPRSTYRC
jgi:hypothetical protein